MRTIYFLECVLKLGLALAAMCHLRKASEREEAERTAVVRRVLIEGIQLEDVILIEGGYETIVSFPFR